MTWLIDTNVFSEVRKGARCHPGVAAWWMAVEDRDLFLSALTLDEIRRGIEGVRPRDPAQAGALEAWLAAVIAAFGQRVLGVDPAVAEAWGRMSAARSVPVWTRCWRRPPACTAWCSSPATPPMSKSWVPGC